jgi:hypothetical protein
LASGDCSMFHRAAHQDWVARVGDRGIQQNGIRT